jgi:hypothetical protein
LTSQPLPQGKACTKYPSVEKWKLFSFAQGRLKRNRPLDLLSGISEMSKNGTDSCIGRCESAEAYGHAAHNSGNTSLLRHQRRDEVAAK